MHPSPHLNPGKSNGIDAIYSTSKCLSCNSLSYAASMQLFVVLVCIMLWHDGKKDTCKPAPKSCNTWSNRCMLCLDVPRHAYQSLFSLCSTVPHKYQCKRLPGNIRLRNDLLSAEWDSSSSCVNYWLMTDRKDSSLK